MDGQTDRTKNPLTVGSWGKAEAQTEETRPGERVWEEDSRSPRGKLMRIHCQLPISCKGLSFGSKARPSKRA